MKEHNQETLRKALEQLPQHQPPKSVWEGIAHHLSPANQAKHRYGILGWGVVASLFILLAISYFLSIRTPTQKPPSRIEAEQAIDSSHALEPIIEMHIDTLSEPADSARKE